MNIETPEFLALQAEHKQTCELSVQLKTDLEAKTAEVASLSAKLSEAATKLQDADKAITELRASMEKSAADHAAALSDFEKKVADKAATLLAATGTTPVKLGSADAGTKKEPKQLVTELEAITDPTERIRFYRANKEAIDMAYRA